MQTRSRALSRTPLAPTILSRLWLALAALIFASLTLAARADDKVVRIGYQKYGTLVLLKGRGNLEPKLKALGYRVQWSEFPSGPPLLEALNAGAIDFGSAGETPPIFAQAASDALAYVAHEPAAPQGEAILVPKASPIRSVADLRGKKVALNKARTSITCWCGRSTPPDSRSPTSPRSTSLPPTVGPRSSAARSMPG